MYRRWAKLNNFESMLPSDIKTRKAATWSAQQQIEGHLVEKKASERVIPYSHENFRVASIEWLVATDQVSRDLHLGKYCY